MVEKRPVSEEYDPPEWLVQAAEGEENVRPFLLGWNKAVEEIRKEGENV